MTIKEYTKEFFKLSIRDRKTQRVIKRVAKYINGLRYEIQVEINLLNLKTAEYAYQAASKVEEKSLRKQNKKNEGEVQQEGKDLQTEEVSSKPLNMRKKVLVSKCPKEEDSRDVSLMLEEEEKIEK